MSDFTFWELLRGFFEAMKIFLQLYTTYEEKVMDHARRYGVPRENLSLPVEEISELLDFKALEILRNEYLLHLKDMSHRMFRTSEATDSFDRYVTTIFHMVSILKEEHYSLRSFGPHAAGENEPELSLLEEAHQFFPRRVSRIESLFESARARIEQLLPQQAGDTILVRSVYLYGDRLFDPFYEGPLAGFYRRMYLEGGPLEGYFEAGRSFHASGFYDLASEALRKALAVHREEAPAFERADAMVKEIHDILKDIKLR